MGILRSILAGRASVELIKNLLGDTVEEFLGVDTEKVPCLVERFEDCAGLVGGLGDEGAFEFFEELEGEFVFGGEGFFSDDGFHGGWVGVLGLVG